MKILLFMSHGGYARNFEWTLRALVEGGDVVHVAVNRLEKKNAPDLNDLLEQIALDHPNLTFGLAPPRRRRDYVGSALRSWLDYLRFLEAPYRDAEKARDRAAGRVPGVMRVATRVPPFRNEAGLKRLYRLISLAERTTPVSRPIRRFITAQRPDLVAVTPLVELGSPQTDYIRAAKSCGIPTALLVASWDNLTTKGGIHVVPELTAVWNDLQRREAQDLHGLPNELIAVTGAVAYDHWFECEPSPREEFCERVGLDARRQYILYAGSSRFIAPQENRFFFRLLSSLRDTDGLRKVQMFVRPHPTNPFRGARAPGRAAMRKNIVIDRDGVNPSDASTRQDYFDSIYHAAAVVGINTSAMVESAIVGRPVHSILTDEYAGTQLGTLHFRYLLPEQGGHVLLARSLETLNEELVASLRAPDSARARDAAFVASFLRPNGIDRPASPELVAALRSMKGKTVVEQDPVSFPARLLGRLVALTAMLVLFSCWVFVRPAVSTRNDLHRLRKALARRRLAQAPVSREPETVAVEPAALDPESAEIDLELAEIAEEVKR